MRVYLGKNVYDAAIERIEFFFDEFDNIIVGFSGGKDSTVVLNLTLEVARKRKRKIRVLFLDQESEHNGTVEYVRKVMQYPEVIPMWMQIPMKISNGSSQEQPWIYCWKKGEEWLRPKEEISYKEDKYGSMTFATLFEKILAVEFPDTPTCYLTGVRGEESPGRTLAMRDKTYKHVTYGKKLNIDLKHYSFHPIYDWTYKDVWKYIYTNDIEYNSVYDKMYQIGIPINKMRVSSLVHETAMQIIDKLQRLEPELYDKLSQRLNGVSTAKHLEAEFYKCPKQLPPVFDSWDEYAEYLTENLIQDDELLKKYRKRRKRIRERYLIYPAVNEYINKLWITTLLHNDYHFTKMHNGTNNPVFSAYMGFKEKGKKFTQKNRFYELEKKLERANLENR